MATVRLTYYEVRNDLLPPLCMKCGAPAAVHKSKTFAWHPPWVAVLILAGLLPWAIVAMILTKRMTVRMPFCEQHRNYWGVRAGVIWSGLVFFFLLGILGIVLLANADAHRGGPAEVIGPFICIGSVVGGLIWLITVAIMQNLSIRPTEITDRDITLTHVSRDFEDALWDDREPPEEEESRPRRRRDREDDDYRRGRRRDREDDDYRREGDDRIRR
jgi:hypothetical protein